MAFGISITAAARRKAEDAVAVEVSYSGTGWTSSDSSARDLLSVSSAFVRLHDAGEHQTTRLHTIIVRMATPLTALSCRAASTDVRSDVRRDSPVKPHTVCLLAGYGGRMSHRTPGLLNEG